MIDSLHHYSEVWLADFEYRSSNGERPEPLCMVAREWRSGRTIRVWSDELGGLVRPPFSIGPDSLFVAFYASAEFGCFRELGWSMPSRILDLFPEFRCHTNGLATVAGNGLLGALAHYGLPSIEAAEKNAMRDLALRPGPHTVAEQAALLAYCETDVDALAKLLPVMLPKIDLPRALLRGRYMAAVASMEGNGIPIDLDALNALRNGWDSLKGRLVAEVDKDFGVYVQSGVRIDPKTESGRRLFETAEEWGADAHDLAAAAKDVWKEGRHYVGDRRGAVQAARRSTGLTLKKLQAWEEAGKDHSTWPDFDTMARTLAAELPDLGIGQGYQTNGNYDTTNYGALLWDLLRQEDPPAVTRHSSETLAAAAKILTQDGTRGRTDRLTFSSRNFAAYLSRNNIPWPRLSSGSLALDDDTFRQMARSHPAVAPLRELRYSLGTMRLFSELAVGTDGRNRCMLSAFRATSSRNQPSTSRFIFGPSCWLRSLIQPESGRAIAYVDWSQQEFGIAAALSKDANMMQAYSSGDPYLTFAKQAKAVPADATKKSHPAVRELFKTCALGVQYGMEAESLAKRMDQPTAMARELLQLHRQTYSTFWKWSQAAVDHAMLRGWLQTVFGWRVQVGPNANPRSLANFPMQANGAEMLRLACCLATERGIQVCAPVHDALLVEGPEDEIDEVVTATQAAMAEASRVVLSSFELRSDAKIVTHPDRYVDPRGETMWVCQDKLI